MKKSVILIILGIYLLSIFVVGYFGMKVAVYDQKIYVDDIEIYDVQVDGKSLEIKEMDGKIYVTVPYTENLVVWILVKISPDDATDRKYKFIVEDNSSATVDNVGRLYFKKPSAITVTVKAADRNKISKSIIIFATEN